MAKNPFDQFDNATPNTFDQFDNQPEPAKPASAARKLADLGLGFASGAVGATKALTDVAGAGNKASKVLADLNTGINDYLSPEAKADQQEQGRIMSDAGGKGVWEGVRAGAKAFAVAPVQTAVQGLGSVVPIVAGTALTGGAAPAAAVGAGIGVAMGAGTAKGAIYDEIKKRGGTEEQAIRAQEYGGSNTDQIALGGALGVVDALTGVSKAASGVVRGALGKPVAQAATQAAERGIVSRAGMGMLGEMPLEAAQGGQEQVAANLAAQRAGYEAGTWDNVASNATMEALASAGPGAAFGAMDTGNKQTPPPPPPPPPPAPQPDQPAPPAGLLGNTPDPLISFPDGIVGRRSEVDTYVASLPEDQQPAMRARLMGLAPQPAIPAASEAPVVEPVAPPSVQMGIDPSYGPLSRAAATAVDKGHAQEIQLNQANAQQQEQPTVDTASQSISDPLGAYQESMLSDADKQASFLADGEIGNGEGQLFARIDAATRRAAKESKAVKGVEWGVSPVYDGPEFMGFKVVRKGNSNVSDSNGVQPDSSTSRGNESDNAGAGVGTGTDSGIGLGADAGRNDTGRVGVSGEQTGGADAEAVSNVQNPAPAANDSQAEAARDQAPEAVASDAAPATELPGAGSANLQADGVTGIEPWLAEFKRAKEADDKTALQALYNKVRVSLNGPAQARGDDAVKQFEKLKSDIELYASKVSQPAQPGAPGQGAGVSQPTQTAPAWWTERSDDERQMLLKLSGFKNANADWSKMTDDQRSTIGKHYAEFESGETQNQKLKKSDLDHLFGVDQKRTKALDRIAAGKAWFSNPMKAADFITKNGLKVTHKSVRTGPKRWDVQSKESEENATLAPANTAQAAINTVAHTEREVRIASALANGGHVVGTDLRDRTGMRLLGLTAEELKTIPADKVRAKPSAEAARTNSTTKGNEDGTQAPQTQQAEAQQPQEREPGQPVDAEKPSLRKAQAKRKAAIEAVEAEEAKTQAAARADYFTPGNIVKSYGGHDEVLAYNAPTSLGGSWSVRVHAVEQRDGKWVRQGRPQDAREHSTQPEPRNLAAGPVVRLPYQPAAEVQYSEARGDGKPFSNAVDRGTKPTGEVLSSDQYQMRNNGARAHASGRRRVPTSYFAASSQKEWLAGWDAANAAAPVAEAKQGAPVAPKPEIVVDKAEMRPYRKPDGSVGYEAEPISEEKTPQATADKAQAATETVAKPDAKAALSEKEKAAKAKMFNALGKLATLAGKNARMNWTQEEEQQLLPIVIELFDGAMELGAVSFQQAVAYVRDFITTNLDSETADAIPFDTLQGAYISVAGRHKDKPVTPKKEVVGYESLAELVTPEPEKIEQQGRGTLTAALSAEILSGKMPKDNPALKKLVEAFDGRPADQSRMKEAQEALEAAIVSVSRDVVAKNEGPRSTFDALLRLYESQPNLNIRTSTSIANQAYSTPAPLAFLGSELAGVSKATTVYEPTAGNGMLTIGAKPSNVTVNELEAGRIESLKAQGFKEVLEGDALEAKVAPKSQDRVMTNPPFGSIKDSKGVATKVLVDGFKIGQIDHLIAARALETMKDDGKATLIIGANKVAGGLNTDDRIFFNWLYGNYNVTSHFEVEGDLYLRQGAGWPVRVITIGGRVKSGRASPVAGTIQRAQNWEQVYEHFAANLDANRAKPEPGAVSRPGGASAGQAGVQPVRQPVGKPNAAGSEQGQAGSAVGAGNVAGASTGNGADSAEQPNQQLGGADSEQRLNAESVESDRLDPAGDSVVTAPAKSAGSAGATALSTAENQFQVTYEPRSSRKDGGVLIPVNMKDPTRDALSRLEDAVGNIDDYAVKQLGYTSVEELHGALMGLQVDSVASAIYQIEQGKGVIIADQTGIGKGRQAAAVIRWAERSGHIPVFVSVKPSLFTDMYGDLHDIGSDNINPFILNKDESIKGPGDTKLFANKAMGHKQTMERIRDNGKLPEGSNAIFMTYSQVNTDNVQRQMLTSLADRAVFILDESHNAGGQSNTGEFITSLLEGAKGVTYLSATYAKRPDNMPLYFKTDIGQAAADNEGLMQAMANGGLPLQTVVSNNLVKAGQMFRREQSYDGVSIETIVDTKHRADHEALSDETTKALRAIVDADAMFHEVFVKQMNDELQQSGGAVTDNAGNQAQAGVDHTQFSSVVHNFVKQMLLGLKAQRAADDAIAALKLDEKPIIAVENTMGSFLEAYAKDNMVMQGGDLGSFDYRTVLSRALARTRVLNEVLPNGDKAKREISLAQLDEKTREAYDAAQQVIDSLDLDIPVSPIDWIRNEVRKAGFTIAEITGRKLAVDYSVKGKATLGSIDSLEQTDKVRTTRLFNSGRLDALILNVAGSTGISLHASEKFQDQRQRHMIIAQAAGDINIFMQMLGRVHRTGQVKLPKYSILSVDLPTEKRPTAVLSGKMKSLNANTSSNTDSSTSIKTVDMFNKYGDKVVSDYLRDNYALARALSVEDLIGGDDVAEDLARKATGRLALQPITVQHAFYEEVEAQYSAMMEYLNKTNQNDLEPRTFDYDVQETRQDVLFEGANKDSPFGEDAIYGEYSIKAQGKAMTPAEIREAMAANLGAKVPAAHMQEGLAPLLKQFEAYIATLEGPARDSANTTRASGQSFMMSHPIGSTFRVDINGDSFNAVVTNIRNTHKANGNPFSLSKIQVTLALNGALRSITVPATQFQRIEVSSIGRGYTVEQLFKEQPANQRETAKIVTGNLLAAYGELTGVRGTIIAFTKQDGTTEQGILLPKTFDFKSNTRGDYRLATAQDALTFLQKIENADIGRFGIQSRDGVVRVLPAGQGIAVLVPKSKLKGGKYFLDAGLIGALGDFVTSGSAMKAITYDKGNAIKALDLLMKKNALYAIPSMAEEAKALSSPTDLAAFSRPTFSRGAQSQANESVERLATGIASHWENAPKVVVAFDMNDPIIPENVRKEDQRQRSGGATGTPEGFYYKGVVYLMSSKLGTPNDVARVLFHEALGHAGLRGAFGGALKPILRDVAVLRRAEVEAKLKQYGLKGISNMDRLIAAEEVLAEMAQTRPELGFVQRAIAAIRTWLRQNVPGFNGLRVTNDELIRNYILPARRFVENGGGPKGGVRVEPTFSRGKDGKSSVLSKHGFFNAWPKFNSWTRAEYNDVVSLLPKEYRSDAHRAEPLSPKDRDTHTAAALPEIQALNSGVDGDRGFRFDALGNIVADMRDGISTRDLLKAADIADKHGLGVFVTGVRADSIQALASDGFVSEYGLGGVLQRVTGANQPPRPMPANIYGNTAYGTMMSYKPRGFATPMFSRSTSGNEQKFQPLANQSTAKALNATLVKYGLGQDWENAYEAVKLPDALSGIRQALQAALGRDVRPIAPTADKFNIFNGVYIPSQPDAVYVNVASNVGFLNIAGHELWHLIKRQRPELIDWYRTQARKFYKDLPAYRDRLNKLLQEGESEYNMDKAEEELEADFLGDSLTDVAFLQALADASPTKFKALLAQVRLWLAGALSRMKGLGSSKEVTDAKALQGYLKEVLVAFAEGKAMPAAPGSIAMSRGTNKAMTNNDVVGNQGGRFTEEQAAEEIANDDDLFNTVVEYTADNPDVFEDKPEMAQRMRSILAKVTPYEPWFKTYYRGEPSNSPNTDRKRGFKSWSGNERTAKEFSEEYRDGVVRQRSGKSRAVALSTIFTARMRIRDGESYYTGDQAESFILDGNESTAPDSGGAMFSRSLGDTLATAANNVHDVNLPAGYTVGDLLKSAPGKVSWWHKTVGTMYNLAERSPQFKRVFDGVQNFINDVSYYATEAADLAPKILPKLETWKDIGKAPLSAEDTKAISAPIFEGTLIWARDEAGKPIKIEELEAQAATLTPEQKAQRLLRNDKVSDQVLRMWQGLPLDQYEAIIEGKYEREMLKAGVVWTDAELRTMFNLTDKQIPLYREFRKATDKSLTNLAISDMLRFGGKDVAAVRARALESSNAMQAAVMLRDHLLELADSNQDRSDVLIDTANKMIEKADKAQDLIARGYAPLSRYGQFTLDVVDRDGERVYFGMFESKIDAARMARRMEQEYPGATITRGTVSEEEYKLFAGVSPETLELFGDMLGLEAQGDSAASKAFQTYLKLAKSNRSSMKRMIQRKGIAGFSEDSGRVLAGFVYSNARQTASNLHMGEMTDAANEVAKTQGELKDQAVRLVDYVKNPREEAQAFRGLLFAQYIGGSVASAMVNMTQPLTMTFPWLSQYTSVADAAKQMTAAMKDANRKLTGDTRLDAALKRAEEDGTVSPQEVHQLMQQSQGRGALRSGDGTKAGDVMAAANNALSRFSLGWGKLFSLAEQFNRRATFIAAYRTAVAKGIDAPEAFARKAIAETQGIYNKGNKPNWARGAVGSTLFTFKQYSIAYVEMLHRMATQGGPEGKKAAMLALAMLFLMSGAGGMPGGDDLDDLISGIMQRLGYNYDSKTKRQEFFASIVGEGGAQFLERGVSGLPGVPIDVSGRLGMGNLIPGTGLLVKKVDHTRDLAEIVGPGGDFVKRGFDAAGKLLDGNVFGANGAAATVAPKATQNWYQSYDMARMGMYRDSKGMKVLDTDGYDVAMKFIGFQPNDVKKVQDASFEAQRMIGLNKLRETEIANRWALGIFEKDADKVKAAREELAQWNAANPESPIRINFKQILQRAHKMNQSKAERITATAPKEIRADVRRALDTQ